MQLTLAFYKGGGKKNLSQVGLRVSEIELLPPGNLGQPINSNTPLCTELSVNGTKLEEVK